MFALFSQYVLNPIENYFVGDIRTFSEFSEDEHATMKFHSFGLLGSVAVWTPNSKEEMAAVLNELESQPNSRANYRAPQLLVGGSYFLLSDATMTTALPHRKAILRHGTPEQFAFLTWKLWKQQFEEGGVIHTYIETEVIAQGLMGIELSEKECESLNKLSKLFKKYSTLPKYMTLLRFTPTFRREQREYQQYIEQILQKSIHKIRESQLERSGCAQNQGLLSQEILRKIEQDPNRTDLHKDSDLKALILVLLAVDNLSNALAKATAGLIYSTQFDLLTQEIQSSGVILNGTLQPSILLDANTMPVLDRLYRWSIYPTDRPPILGRYVQNGLQCGDHHVPPNTYLAITPPLENPSHMDAFSAGRRSCPGKRIAEAIFKTRMLAKIAHLPPSSASRLHGISMQYLADTQDRTILDAFAKL